MKTVNELLKENSQREDAIKIVDRNESFRDAWIPGIYGTDYFILTKLEIELLKNGKVLVLPENGGEYQMFLAFENI